MKTPLEHAPFTPREIALGNRLATALWVISGALLVMLLTASTGPN